MSISQKAKNLVRNPVFELGAGVATAGCLFWSSYITARVMNIINPEHPILSHIFMFAATANMAGETALPYTAVTLAATFSIAKISEKRLENSKNKNHQKVPAFVAGLLAGELAIAVSGYVGAMMLIDRVVPDPLSPAPVSPPPNVLSVPDDSKQIAKLDTPWIITVPAYS